MFLRIIKSYRDVVVVCDSDLIGKKFQEGETELDVKESFFKGGEKSEEEIVKILKDMLVEDATFNLVGKDSVNAGMKAEILTSENVREVQGVPFALILD